MADSFIEFLHPHLNNKLLESIAKDYKLDKLVSWNIIPGGWANINLLLTTSKNKFVLRFYRYGKKKRQDISNTIQVANYLKIKKFPVPVFLKSQSADFVIERKIDNRNIYLTIYKYIDGERKLTLSNEEISSAGKMLAGIHLALKSSKLKTRIKNWQYFDNFNNVSAKLINKINNNSWNFEKTISKDTFLETVKLDLDNLEKLKTDLISADFPETVMHGDFHAANLIFKNNKIAGILDFDSIITGPQVLDLAICAANLQIQHVNVNEISKQQIYNLLVSGYKSANQLSDKELEFLPKLVKFWVISQFVWLFTPVTSNEQLLFYQQVFENVWRVYTKN